MKFQIPNIHHSKVNRRTHRQTDRQAESNMPFQLFQSWGHKNLAGNTNKISKNAMKALFSIMSFDVQNVLYEMKIGVG